MADDHEQEGPSDDTTVMPEDGDPDFIEFAKGARYISVIGESLLVQHFGRRCPDFETDCICCKRWKALDDLIENPFAA